MSCHATIMRVIFLCRETTSQEGPSQGRREILLKSVLTLQKRIAENCHDGKLQWKIQQWRIQHLIYKYCVSPFVKGRNVNLV